MPFFSDVGVIDVIGIGRISDSMSVDALEEDQFPGGALKADCD